MRPVPSPRLHRVGVLAIATAVASSTVIAAAPAQAHPAGDRAVSAGGAWLESQLTGGLVHNNEYDFDDLGLSADVAFALDAVGGRQTTVAQIADAVAPRVMEWYDSFGTTYAGSAAKAMALAQVAGKDATDFGGTDLQAVVEDAVAGAAPIVGRVQNLNETDWQTGTPTDSLNVIGQSWAVRGLAGQDSTLADEAESFLLEQQCDAGFFRAGLTADKAAAEQGCDPGTDSPNLDTTALVLINLAAVEDPTPAVTEAIEDAAAWLVAQQAADGSLGTGTMVGANANTTGLAGWAMAVAGRTAAAAKTAGWLRGVQVADLAPCATTLAAENGAIAYTPEALSASRAAGAISLPMQDQYRRASAQALPALAHVPAAVGTLGISAPTTAVENSTVTVNVTGLGAGELACVSFGSQARQVTGTGGVVDVPFALPAGAATHTFRLTTLAGARTATTSTTSISPTPAPTPAPTLTPASTTPLVGELVAAKVERVKDNVFALAVACDSAETCTGKLKVRAVRKLKLANGTTRTLVLAKSAYSVEPGRSARIKLELTRPARAALGSERLRVAAVQTARGAESASTPFWLRRK